MKKTLLLILAAVFSLSMYADDAVYTSNVTWTAGSNAEVSDVAIINETEYLLLKLGTSSKTGSATTTLPAGTTSFSFYCVAWNNKGNAPYTVTIGSDSHEYTATANSGLANNSPFTLAVDEFSDDDYHTITFDALTEETTLTIETTSTSLPRIGVFGANYAPYTEEGNDDNNSGSDFELTGSGTVDDPYTCADAVALVNAKGSISDVVYVKGTITSLNIYTGYGDATYYISDDGTTTSDQVEVYNGYGYNGEQITTEDYLQVGDVVVVYGTLTVYKSTVEFNAYSSIYSINEKTADDIAAEVDMDDPYTSNTTWTNIENAEPNDKAKIGDEEKEYLAVKLGTSSKLGSAYTTLPAGTTSFEFYAVAWNNTTATYTVVLDGIGEKSYTANANSTLSGSSTYTITESELSSETDYHAITFSALAADTKLTVKTTDESNPRIVVFGAKYYSEAIEGAEELDELSEEEGEGEGEGETTTEAVSIDNFTNGGFEDWTDDSTPVAWVSTTSASKGTVKQSEDAHDGNYSAQIAHSSSTNNRLASQEYILPAGTYTVSFYAKSVDADGLAEIAAGYVPWDEENDKIGSYKYDSYYTISADEWDNITWEFELEEETQLNLVIMNHSSGNGDVLIDDYTITSDATGIHAIDAASTLGTGAIYNLSGQKVTESYRGIVIVDGKKVLNK